MVVAWVIAGVVFTGGAVSQPQTAVVAGRVVVEGTGVPIADAHVVLVPMSRPQQPASGPPRQTSTNDQGEYVFDDVPPGTYRVNVRKTGFANPLPPGPASSPVITVEQGSVEAPDIALLRGGALAGRVLDPSGEPAMDTQLRAYRRTDAGPFKGRLIQGGGGSTNDLGEFRIFGLAPGQYVVSAGPQPQSPYEVAGTPASQTYASTFYPSVTDATAAPTLELAPGQTIDGIVIRLVAIPAFRVSGTVLDGSGRRVRNAFVSLTASSASVAGSPPIGFAHSDERGRFAIGRVPPGTYHISASAPSSGPGSPQPYSERMQITVRDAAVQDVVLVLQPYARH